MMEWRNENLGHISVAKNEDRREKKYEMSVSVFVCVSNSDKQSSGSRTKADFRI